MNNTIDALKDDTDLIHSIIKTYQQRIKYIEAAPAKSANARDVVLADCRETIERLKEVIAENTRKIEALEKGSKC